MRLPIHPVAFSRWKAASEPADPGFLAVPIIGTMISLLA
ncbi:hypothetical protein J2T11_003185 [Paenarthrobacter nicotinovorans]|nr:hypothetical protein [Paenarthrobacter nicotinovorans]